MRCGPDQNFPLRAFRVARLRLPDHCRQYRTPRWATKPCWTSGRCQRFVCCAASSTSCVRRLGQLKSIKLGDLQRDPAQSLVQLNSLDHRSKRVAHRLEASRREEPTSEPQSADRSGDPERGGRDDSDDGVVRTSRRRRRRWPWRGRPATYASYGFSLKRLDDLHGLTDSAGHRLRFTQTHRLHARHPAAQRWRAVPRRAALSGAPKTRNDRRYAATLAATAEAEFLKPSAPAVFNQTRVARPSNLA